MKKNPSLDQRVVRSLRGLMVVVLLLVAAWSMLVVLVVLRPGLLTPPEKLTTNEPKHPARDWLPPDINALPATEEANRIRYGRELIVRTAVYLGPKGSVAKISNGMNCQNCHLDAGTKPFGNNFSAVAANYPRFRARSGTEETIEKRVNDCLERSLNGKPLDERSAEMRAMVAYIHWLGKDVPKGATPAEAGLPDLPFLQVAADPVKGAALYEEKCTTCHGKDGAGIRASDSVTFVYPPLWGNHSFNSGAGLFRLSKMAGYIKANMPLGASYAEAQLTDEEAWYIAAYVNSMPRPAKDIRHDWPDIRTKPVDHPFGPYADGFSELQHKYGPFQPIADQRKAADNSRK